MGRKIKQGRDGGKGRERQSRERQKKRGGARDLLFSC